MCRLYQVLDLKKWRKYMDQEIISENVKKTFRERGLILSDTPDFPSRHYSYPNGFGVTKPADIPGNGHSYYLENSDFDEEEGDIKTDAPTIVIWTNNKKWRVCKHEIIPGPGVSDFNLEFFRELDLIEMVLSYYFNKENELFRKWYKEINERDKRNKIRFKNSCNF